MEAIVEYNYVAQEPDELTLRKGDIIREIKVMPGGWWEGTLRDKCGMFPDNFVKILTPSPSGNGTLSLKSEVDEVTLRNGSSGRQFCKVLFSYEPCNEDELALSPQDMIEYLGEVEEGWWKGRLRGRIGVFPSNFVTPPTLDESERESKEYCRVLFPYKASNDDELSLEEGDIVTLLSRDAPDKGWWRGELNGRIGLFPDNFVAVVGPKIEGQPSLDTAQSSKIESVKYSHTGKKEKAGIRKSLDVKTAMESTKKVISSSSSIVSSSSSVPSMQMGNSIDKKASKATHPKPSDVEFSESNDIVLGEELDGVERGEGAPLSHLTASRAKAPRRRLPSSQHFRSQGVSNLISGPTLEENIANGDTIDREDENDGIVSKARRKAPWIEELKQNQMEKRKVLPPEKVEKPELVVKKERSHPMRPQLPSSIPESEPVKSHSDNSAERQQDREPSQRPESSSYLTCPVSPSSGATPAYVPYRVYNQLLDRVNALEEKYTVLQRTVVQLSEQLSSSVNKH